MINKKRTKKKKEDSNDVIMENDIDESAFSDASDALGKVKEKLKKCEEEKREYLDGWQRAKADMVNLSRKGEENRVELVKYANESLIKDIIPVLDSFSIAMVNTKKWEELPEEWRKGVEYIYSQLKKVLSDHGVEEFSPEGEKFDPSLHEAVENVEVDDESKDSIIVEVIQKGYKLNDKILRSAKVKVGVFNN